MILLFFFVSLKFIERVQSIDEDLCRLIEFNVPEHYEIFPSNQFEDRLFYKTNFVCQNKPVYRSLKFFNLYQLQSANNRWWTLYNTTNSTYELGTREWCDGWHFQSILAMPLGIYQHPLSRSKRTQRWQRVIFHQNNRTYSYKSITSKSID